MADRCREIAAQFGSAHVGMNSNYFASNSKSIDFVTVFGIAALVLAGGYVVIQSIFRISVNDKIQSYGQLRTIGATPRQIRRIVKKESRKLGGILLLVVSSMILTRSPEQAARLFFPDGDIKIYLSSEQPEEAIMAAGNPLDENLRQEILSVDGVTDANRMDVEAALVSGAMPADTHSILLSTAYQKHHADMDVGAAIELTLGQKTVTVTISGLFDASKAANGHGALAMDSAALFAPEELFREIHPEIESFDYSWSIVNDPAKAEFVESSLQELVSGRSNLGMDTIDAHIEYEKMQSSIIFGSLQALSWLIFLFGVVNLINTTLSNQMSRKRENSILRSVGLTGKQLCRMSITEGMCHALFAALTVLILGLPLSMAVCVKCYTKVVTGVANGI